MNAPRLSPPDTTRLLAEGYVYLDVRTQAEFDLGHPSGAYNVPFMLSTPSGSVRNEAFLRVVEASFTPDTKLVIGCHTGERSRAACALLASAGFHALAEQRAGFAGARDAFGRVIEKGWQAQGFESSVSAQPGRDYAALLARAETITPSRA